MKHILEDSSMKFFGQTLAVLFGVALLGVLSVGGYFALKCIVELFESMDIQVAAVTAIVSVITLLATLIIASSIRQAGKQNTANQFHTEKVATYEIFIALWVDLLRHGHGAENHSSNPLSEE